MTARSVASREAIDAHDPQRVMIVEEGEERPGGHPNSPTLASTAFEPCHAFIEAQLRLNRNFMAIYQDLGDKFGFGGAYNSVKRFAGGLQQR